MWFGLIFFIDFQPECSKGNCRCSDDYAAPRQRQIPIFVHHDAPAVEFHWQWRVLQPGRTHREHRRVRHPATDTRQVRRRVSIRVDQKVCAEQPSGSELQLASMAGGCQHGGQETRHPTAQRYIGVQIDEQTQDRIQSGCPGMSTNVVDSDDDDYVFVVGIVTDFGFLL